VQKVLALGDSGRVPHAGPEARRVAALFPAGIAYVGEAATIAHLQRDAPAADLLHLACHARFRADNPRFSALQLADGALTVDLAEALELGPCTVVMSACETGLTSGDEAVGLVRAFLVAGAARVVASLWPVDDRVTAAFMQHFHEAARAGAGSAQALRAAQDAVAAEHPHPHFWGAFALHGGF
jgi:CHAT domain-containing protein